MNNQEPKVLFTIDESSEVYQDAIKNIKKHDDNNINSNKEKIVTYIILLKFIKTNNSDIKYDLDSDIEESNYNDNDAVIIDYFDSHSFIICRGMENLKNTVINLLNVIESIDLENSIILSDNKMISYSLGIEGNSKNSLLKYLSINSKMKKLSNEYLEYQKIYLDSMNEIETCSNEFKEVLDELEKIKMKNNKEEK